MSSLTPDQVAAFYILYTLIAGGILIAVIWSTGRG